MTPWPRWGRGAAPGALTQYVQRDVVARLLPGYLAAALPGPSDQSALVRAHRIYQIFASHDIGYVHEPTSSEPGRQAIRHPGEVLAGPRRGTCLDIAVAFSGACLDAGLHPMIVAVESTRGGPGHAIVVVWLGGSWARTMARDYPWQDDVHHFPPAELIDQLRASADQPGAFLAIDVAGVAAHTPWDAAIAAGTSMVTSTTSVGAWRWGVAVDIGVAWHAEDALPMPQRPTRDPLVKPYLEADPDKGPLMQLRARRSVVPFYGRDELDVLLDWCQTPDIKQHAQIAVLHGVGGAGKTHLAAELASKLTAEGWYTGFLARTPDPADLPWLASMVSPLLVVIDYTEEIKAEAVASVLQALRNRTEPTCLVLTARALGGWWKEITSKLEADGCPYTALPPLELPRRHPSATGVFQRALRAFAQLPGMTPTGIDTPPPDRRWTTLDLIMLAWLAALGAAELPTSPQELYDEILNREFGYWTGVCQRRGMSDPPERLLPAVGACVTLLAPAPDRIAPVLSAVEAFDNENQWRHEIAAVVEALLPSDSDAGTVAIRPDPVGERLVLRELGPDQGFLRRCIGVANDQERLNACVTISRAAEHGKRAATAMATIGLEQEPGLWQPALAVVAARGGPFELPLQTLADRDDSPLPLEQLADSIPLRHPTLQNLAVIVTRRTRPPDPVGPTDITGHARIAEWWNHLSNRLADSGDRAGALAAIAEAVGRYRRLLETTSTAFLPDLAMSLNNLSLRRSEAGDRTGALAASSQAVQIIRRLNEAQPDAFLPGLACFLNNLSAHQVGIGDRADALASITEAVRYYRRLSETERDAFLPDLARSLSNQSLQQSSVGDRAGALTSGTEAVRHFRRLTHANFILFLPELATSLNNLSNHQSDNGDRDGALDSISEAIGYCRRLVEIDPAAFLTTLAQLLHNLSAHQSKAGDRTDALDSITEAVEHYRGLAETEPAAFIPDLANSLNHLSNHQSAIGDRAGALHSITEAVGHFRQLAEDIPAVFLPDLAMSLNTLSSRQSKTGNRAGALGSSTESVGHYRQLTETEPAAFLPDLARSLINLSRHQADVGDWTGALASATEAVEQLRHFADAEPEAFGPDFATSLTNLSLRQSETGDRDGALASSMEAVDHFRLLADAEPDAFLINLANSLVILSSQRAGVGDRVEALASATEAVRHLRLLAVAQPDAFLPALATSLQILSNQQSDTGDEESALASCIEAVDHCRHLADKDATFLDLLASLLNNLSNRLAASGGQTGAMTSITEAVGHYRRLAEAHTDAFLPYLATSLNSLSLRQSETSLRADALASCTEAVGHYRQLAEANPDAFLPHLARSLNNLSNRQFDTGDRASAVTSIAQAIAIRRQLVLVAPAAFLPDLANSLYNLSLLLLYTDDQAGAVASITEAVGHFRQLTETNPAAFLCQPRCIAT